MLGQRRVVAVILALGMVLAGMGCGLETQRTTIHGIVRGQAPATNPGSSNGVIPLVAAVACNGVSAMTTRSGSFMLSVVPAPRYNCRVSADRYQPEAVTIPGSVGTDIELNLGTTLQTDCQPESHNVECPALAFQHPTIAGVVRYQGSYAPAAGALVQCEPLDLQHGLSGDAAYQSGRNTATGRDGRYSLGLDQPGQYGCFADVAGRSAAWQQVVVGFGQSATANFTLCQHHCPPVHYHLGPVMHNYTAYLIFWQPNGVVFEPGGSDERFKSLIQRYFRDVGGTPFFGLLSQYWDTQGPVENRSALGGVWVDTTPYEHCDLTGANCRRASATRRDPLRDMDIEAEIHRALDHNRTWNSGPDNEFFVFTAFGAEECASSDNSECSFYLDKHGFCGYHSSAGDRTLSQGPLLIYAYIPDQANNQDACTWYGRSRPNGDVIADSTIDTVSHEQFESITDPIPDYNPGWYDGSSTEPNGASTEIADKCDNIFGAIGPDGGNITLHGHRYLLQAEWSNRANRCAFS